YTQQQVADLLGITNSTYCGYETGKRQPDVEKIKQLASALNISGNELLEAGLSNTDEADSPKSAKLNKALEIFKTLNPDFQDYALEQIKKLAELQEKK
ncbi:MAG: helix-turn-helix transcriptional regulator, partial [Oscillospiraceae bacterium]|nr:helix-turn-helix transcriptional regulator [Oscillospiraceae bacterium]